MHGWCVAMCIIDKNLIQQGKTFIFIWFGHEVASTGLLSEHHLFLGPSAAFKHNQGLQNKEIQSQIQDP
jgi:hypothetical protein